MMVGYLNTDDINGLQGRLAGFYLEISLLLLSLSHSKPSLIGYYIIHILIFTQFLNLIIKIFSGLVWAAGNKTRDLVSLLLSRGSGEKYGTTPLI